MNQIKTLLLILLVAFSALAWGCNVSYSTANIADAKLAKEVNADKEAVDPTNSFEANIPLIHCVVKLANAPEDTKVKAKWSVVNVPGQEANYKIVESDVTAGGAKNIIDFTFKPPPQGLPSGEYKVDVYLNPKPEKEEPPAKTLTFTIK